MKCAPRALRKFEGHVLAGLLLLAGYGQLVHGQTSVGRGGGAEAEQCPPCPDSCQLRTSCEEYTPFPVNLRWIKSAQFAGFYAAKALGYWEDECLGVSLRPASFDVDPIEYWNYPAEQTVPRVTIPHYMCATSPYSYLLHTRLGRTRAFAPPTHSPQPVFTLSPRQELPSLRRPPEEGRTACLAGEPPPGASLRRALRRHLAGPATRTSTAVPIRVVCSSTYSTGGGRLAIRRVPVGSR